MPFFTDELPQVRRAFLLFCYTPAHADIARARAAGCCVMGRSFAAY
jgi:hypothetical protein